MLGRHEEDIVAAFAGNLHPAEKERLCVYISIYVQGEQFPQALRIYVLRGKAGLTEIGSAACVVILRRGHLLCLRLQGK